MGENGGIINEMIVVEGEVQAEVEVEDVASFKNREEKKKQNINIL